MVLAIGFFLTRECVFKRVESVCRFCGSEFLEVRIRNQWLSSAFNEQSTELVPFQLVQLQEFHRRKKLVAHRFALCQKPENDLDRVVVSSAV